MNFEKKPINATKKQLYNDYLEIENSKGMPGMVDATIAVDFLLGIKSGIRNCAIALTETADHEAREVIRSILDSSLDLHEEVSELMMKKGWLHPYNVNEQFQIDQISAQTALQIANLHLFPDDTSRLGTFATPNY